MTFNAPPDQITSLRAEIAQLKSRLEAVENKAAWTFTNTEAYIKVTNRNGLNMKLTRPTNGDKVSRIEITCGDGQRLDLPFVLCEYVTINVEGVE